MCVSCDYYYYDHVDGDDTLCVCDVSMYMNIVKKAVFIEFCYYYSLFVTQTNAEYKLQSEEAKKQKL